MTFKRSRQSLKNGICQRSGFQPLGIVTTRFSPLVVAIWLAVLGIAQLQGTILNASENRVGKFFSVGYDAGSHGNVGYDDSKKLSSVYDAASSPAGTDSEKRSGR